MQEDGKKLIIYLYALKGVALFTDNSAHDVTDRSPKCLSACASPRFINGPRGSWERRSFVHFHLDLPNHETSWPPCSQMYLNQAWLVNSSDKVETLKRHLAIPTPLTRISNANKQPWSVLCVAFAVCTVGYRLDVVLMVSAMGKPAPLASDPP